jgi:hypothetical protein
VGFIKPPGTDIVLEYPQLGHARGCLEQTVADPAAPVARQHVQRVELTAVKGDKADRLGDSVHFSYDDLASKIPPPLERLDPGEWLTRREDAGVGGYRGGSVNRGDHGALVIPRSTKRQRHGT